MQPSTFVRRLGALLAVSLVSASAWGLQVEAAATVGEWSEQLWASAREGDAARLAEMLHEFETEDGAVLAGLKGAVERYEANVDKREADRQARSAEVRTELEQRLAEAEADAGGFKLSEALVLTMELVELHGGSLAAADLFADPMITRAIGLADEQARVAEAAGQWLKASELFYRLHVLFDVDQRYKADVTRLGRRLAMIRLYAPEHYWELGNARRIEAGEPELPKYNPMGDTYQEKLAGVDSWLVSQSIEVAGTRHVDGNAVREMLVAGLDALQTMATTTELAAPFPGLQDGMAREAFLKNLQQKRDEIASPETPIDQRVLRGLVTWLAEISGQTVQIPEEAVYHEFGNGAMSALDDYSTIIWPDEVRRFERNTRGSFVGVGIQIQHDELMRIKVVTPLEGTPAQRAGVHAEDIITKVNGESTAGFTLDQAVDVITGPENTRVTLTMERDGDGQTIEKDFTLVRQSIKLRSVKGWKRTGASEEDWDWFVDRESGIGYVRLTQFTENTAEDLDDAIDEMQADGLSGLVLDLRFNPGGLLDQAVEVVGEFATSGRVVSTEDADGRPTGIEKLDSQTGKGRLANIPVAVLVNPGSASASEIVSGALQDYAAEGKLDAIIIGQRSFGKGSVQNAWPLRTAAQSMLKVTTQYYRLPNGRLIHRRPGMTEWGVEPDLTVDMLPSQNEAAITLRRDADVLPVDENGNIVATATPQANPDDLLTKGIDLQLEAAVVLLKSRAVGAAQAQAMVQTNPSGT
ncbi:MAG: S41 family peptidase [Phycisphaerales bacterium]|nr:S41 family peptidase [Phycisphaerales bacterium]